MLDNNKLRKLAEKYGLDRTDFWMLKIGSKELPIILHDAVTRIAHQEGIKFDEPIIVSNDNRGIAMKGRASKIIEVENEDGTITEEEISVWSFGEASPTNCRQGFPWAMCEKRLQDRLTLKILRLYEEGLYSEVESDEFKKQINKGE